MAGFKSMVFDPDLVATNSDVASSALGAASSASDKASKASVAAAGVASVASDALSAASDALSKIVATSDKASKASQAAISAVSAASDALSKASVASVAAAEGSNALSKITDRSAAWDRKTIMILPMGFSSVVEDGDGIRFAIPGDLSGMNLVSVGAHVFTPPTSGVMKIYVSNITAASQVLSSEMQIDETESDTVTASSQAVIDTGEDDVQTGVEYRVYASDAASGAEGLQFRLGFEKP